jgi:predicted MPP superfamily phosphohydrolase
MDRRSNESSGSTGRPAGLPARVRHGARVVVRATRAAARSRAARRITVGLGVVTVTLTGIIVGLLLAGRLETDIGPFRAEMRIVPATEGGTTIDIPPLGALHLASHAGPVRLDVQLGALDQGRTEALIGDPASISQASQSAVADVTDGVVRLALRSVAVAVLATLILAALAFRNVRRVAWSGALALLITGGSLGTAALTVRPESIQEPRYEGLLVNAPAIVGDVRQIATDYTKYAEQLRRLVGNVTQLYTTVSSLPVLEPQPGMTRVLHVSDLHLNPTAWQLVRTVVEQFSIDVIIDTGDMTDWGSEPETSFVSTIGQLNKPYVFIRGNHDSAATAAAVARQPNAIVLDDSVVTVAGLTIAGIGDPRFTPDKSTSPAGDLTGSTANQLIDNGERLAATIRASATPVNIALVHDPSAAGPLSGTCPLVLAGHTHNRQVLRLPQVPDATHTDLLVQGSTGGAGLRGLEGESPTPLSMSVLYFNEEKLLQAYDDIRVGGTGEAQVNLERHVLREPEAGNPEASVTPTPTRVPTPTDTPEQTPTVDPSGTPTPSPTG